MFTARTALPLASLLAAAAATQQPPDQKPLTAVSFAVPEPQVLLFVDMKALRDEGIWDEFQVSMLKIAFQQMQKESGLDLDEIDEIRGYMLFDAAAAVPVRTLIVFRGAGVGLPPSVNGDHYQDDEIGGHRVKASAHGGDGTVYARLGSDLMVTGNRSLVEPPLRGKPWSGALTPDQMSLLSGRAPALAHGCWQFTDKMLTDGNMPLRGVEWPAGQRPTHLMVRLRLLGKDDDRRLEMEAIVRHPQAGDAVTKTQDALQQWLQGLKKDPKLGRLGVWDRFRLKQEAQDLAIRLDLGKPRDAAGTLAELLVPLLVPKSLAAEAAAPATPNDK